MQETFRLEFLEYLCILRKEILTLMSSMNIIASHNALASDLIHLYFFKGPEKTPWVLKMAKDVQVRTTTEVQL